MRMRIVIAALLGLGVGLGACSDGADGARGDKGANGETGASGPAGEPGDKGPTGDPGATGSTGATGPGGAAGSDAVCAGVVPLVVTGISDAPTRVFTGDTTPPFTVAVGRAGGGAATGYQLDFLTDGVAPVAAAGENRFTLTPQVPGRYRYTAVVSDGCTLASGTFEVEVVEFTSNVAIVYLATALGDVNVGLTVGGLNGALTAPSTTDYVVFPYRAIDLVFTDASGAVLATTGAIPLGYDGHYALVITDDGAGGVDATLVPEDLAALASPTDTFRLRFMNAAVGLGTVDVTDGAGATLFDQVAELAVGAERPVLATPASYVVAIDVGGNGSDDFVYDLRTGSGGGAAAAGELVTAFAFLDGDAPALLMRRVALADALTTGGLVVTERVVYDVTVGRGTLAVPAAPFEPVPVLSDTLPAVTDAVAVTGACTVATVVVGVDIVHTYRNDLRIALTSPAGTTVLLNDNEFVAGEDFIGFFADVGGTYVPDQPLGGFVGESAVGTWTLSVTDLGVGDEGALNGWSLNLFCQ